MNMSLLEPITVDNIHELQPGEWIWDNKDTERNKHGRSLALEYTPIIEPYGFRQIHILDLNGFMQWQFKPFMLTTIHSGYGSSYTWTYWAEGRFYRFKREE